MNDFPDTRPECSEYGAGGGCKAGSCHSEWEHATSYEQAQKAIRQYGEISDIDGDRVMEIHRVGSEDATIRYRRHGEDDNDLYYNLDNEDGNDIGYLMIPVPPLADEDIQAAIASILGGTP